MSIRKDELSTVSIYLILGLFLFLYTFPLLYLVNVSFKTTAEFALNPVSPAGNFFDFHNFTTALKRGNLIRYSVNTIFYAVASAILTLFVCVLAAFPISRRHVRGSVLLFNIFLASLFCQMA